MKKVLSLIICVIMVVSVCCVVPFTAGAADTLTITDDSGHSVTVEVGQDVLYTLRLYAGSKKLLNGQATLSYTAENLDVDLFGEYEVSKTGAVELYYEDYMFVPEIASLVIANPDIDGYIYFNFSREKGIVAFDNEQVLIKARFKATAPGKATISTDIEYMVNADNVKVYGNSTPDQTINPYTVASLEAAQYIIGDADSDWNVSIKDATLIQKICSGSSDTYSLNQVDCNLDGRLTLKDALGIRKYLAGNTPSVVGTPNFNVGASVFASEQE